MRRVLLVVAVLLSLAVPAAAGKLPSSVMRVPVDPSVIVVPSAGGTLVAIVRLAQANSPDTITVTNAVRDGTKITIAIETRRYGGVLHANVTTTPLVEVALGALDPGTYTIDVHETVLTFTKYGYPETATGGAPGLSSQMTFRSPV